MNSSSQERAGIIVVTGARSGEGTIALSKIQRWLILFFIIVLSFSLFVIYLYGNEETKLKHGEFGQIFPSEDNTNSDILFETNDYIVYRKIRRFDRYFTQGLFMDTKNTIIESSGLYGYSTLQKYNIERPDEKIFKIPLERKYFAEGSCLYDNKIFMLTWKEREILVFNFSKDQIPDKEKIINLPAEIQEGWGITSNNKELIISDGTDRIFFVDPSLDDFKVKKFITVKNPTNNKSYSNLNELEYAYGYIFANVWMSNNILVIDPETGNIKNLLTNFENGIKAFNEDIDVLNGIAYDKYNDGFYITGKLWTHLYYVKYKFKL